MRHLNTLTWLYIIAILAVIMLADQGALMYWVQWFSQFIPYFDKVAHFFLIGILALLVNLSIGCRRVFQVNILLGSIIVFILVGLEEISQLFIPVRTFDWGDLLADILGIAVFGHLAWYWQQNKLRETSQI